VRRYPLTLLLGSLLVALMVATVIDPGLHPRLVDRLSVSWPEIGAGRLWRVPTSSLVQEESGFVWPIAALLPVLPAAEARLGTLRTLLVYVICDAASSLLALGALEIVGDQRLAAEPNIGSSAGLLGLLAAWIATLPAPHRGRAGAALALGVVIALAIDPELAALQHIIAVATGALLGSSVTHLGRRASVA
jgi:membrane associated rhomboid family serine protease